MSAATDDFFELYRQSLERTPAQSLASFVADRPGMTESELAELIAVDQLDRWKLHGTAPSAEEYLAAFSTRLPSRTRRFDVVYGEFRARVLAGQRPEPIEFVRRFPDLESSLERQLELADWLSKESDSPTAQSDDRPQFDTETICGAITALENEAPLSADDFKIVRKLGSGGMGEVYLAHQKSLQKDVALKILTEASRLTPTALERFFREAHAVARLRHSHIVGVHGIGKGKLGYFLLMDYIAGESLAERLKRGPLPVDEAVRMTATVCDAIAHANSRGVVHRDLKPGNILLDKEGRPFVTDFGIAKWSSGNLSELTQPGQILGTPQYMAPEQFDPSLGAIDERTDVYGLGGLLFSALTCQPPIEGKSSPEVLRNLLTSEGSRSARSLRPDVPVDIDRVIRACLSRQPSDRPASALVLKHTLERWNPNLSTRPAESITLPHQRRRNRKIIAVATATATAIALAGSSGWIMWRTWFAPLVVARGEPLMSSWTIDVFRGGLRSRKEQLTSASEPLRSGDQIRVSLVFSQPVYASLYWIGTDGALATLAVTSDPANQLTVPQQSGDGLPVNGTPGTEMCLLLLHARPWSEAERATFERAAAHQPPRLESETLVVDGHRVMAPAMAEPDSERRLLGQLGEAPRSLGAAQPLAETEYDRRVQDWLRSLPVGQSEIHYLAVSHVAAVATE